MPDLTATVARPSAHSHKRIGPYSRHGAIALLDGRSKEALYMRGIRADLIRHLGGEAGVSPVQRQLIGRIATCEARSGGALSRL
jgi:hypothetical protein